MFIFFKSHPLRVRELKLLSLSRIVGKAPSHPLRVRELKHESVTFNRQFYKSHPLRVRELKQCVYLVLITAEFSRTLYGCVN